MSKAYEYELVTDNIVVSGPYDTKMANDVTFINTDSTTTVFVDNLPILPLTSFGGFAVTAADKITTKPVVRLNGVAANKFFAVRKHYKNGI